MGKRKPFNEAEKFLITVVTGAVVLVLVAIIGSIFFP